MEWLFRSASSGSGGRATAASTVEGMILFLVKFMSEEDHVRDLLDGKIYANRLAWFKRAEGEDASGVPDRNEGTVVWHQPDRIHLEINGMDITTDLAGPFQIQSSQLNHLNLFCSYAARIDDSELEGVPYELPEEIRSLLAISERCLSLGEYAVVIKSVPEFIRRVGEAAKAKRYRMWYGPVKYYNSDTYHGSNFDMEAVFQKQDQYSYQSEFRFVIDTQTEGSEPTILEIGDIRDIALETRTTELNQQPLGI